MPLPTSTTLLVAAAIINGTFSSVAVKILALVLVGLAAVNESFRAVLTRPGRAVAPPNTYEIPAQPVQPRVRTPFGSDGG
jgi:hypothetical protein